MRCSYSSQPSHVVISCSHALSLRKRLPSASLRSGDNTLEADPVDRATRGGFQTSASLPQPGDDAIGMVLDRIRVQVDRFETSLPQDLNDPFVTKRPRHVKLRAWAVVYPGGGWQKPHIHDTGWLSGIYYVTAAKASGHNPRSENSKTGSQALLRPPGASETYLRFQADSYCFPPTYRIRRYQQILATNEFAWPLTLCDRRPNQAEFSGQDRVSITAPGWTSTLADVDHRCKRRYIGPCLN
jgi:Putative 2OG-Fe(II) oxygenase